MRTIIRSSSAAVVLAFAAIGCSHASGSDPAQAADSITRSVYANDYDATVANFDDATKKTVTRTELGALSDRMHALGDYKSLTARDANPDTGKYEYDAAFTNGSLLVLLRVDPDGKIGAYRVEPEAAKAASAASPNG